MGHSISEGEGTRGGERERGRKEGRREGEEEGREEGGIDINYQELISFEISDYISFVMGHSIGERRGS
jgi:hypothetical protein